VVAKQVTYYADGMMQTFMDSCECCGEHAITHSYVCSTTIRPTGEQW
jgi:hypothetical protein